MDKSDIKFDIIKECLNKIINSFFWIATIDIMLLIGLFHSQDNFTIGQFVFPLKYITISVLLALIYLIFSITHKFHRIITIYIKTEDTIEKDKIKTFLNLYPSLVNPFTQHDDYDISRLFENMGMGLQTFLYSLGYLLSFQYLFYANWFIFILVSFLAIILTILRFDYIVLSKNIDGIVSDQNRDIKRKINIVFLILAIGINVFVFFIR